MTENQKLREVATELDRLMLVIESAVRHADPRNHASVMALIRANKEALALPTAAPVVEREAFEEWAKDNAIRTDLGAWDAWQARAALSAGDAVDAGKFHKLFEAMDEGRASIIVEGATESIDGGEIFTDIDDALDAIDAAMRKGQL